MINIGCHAKNAAPKKMPRRVYRRGRGAVAFTRRPLSYYYTAAEKLGIAVKDCRLTGRRCAFRFFEFHTVYIG